MAKKQATPALTEKQALEKATGQGPQPESEKDSKPDIQQLDKQIDVAELIRLSMKNAEDIKVVKSALDNDYQQRDNYQQRLDEINDLLKPVSRNRKKLHTTSSSQPIPTRERKILRAERADILRQLNLLREVIADGESKLSSLTGKSSQYSKARELYDKANGKDYVKRNKNLFTSMMLKALNKFYQEAELETISRIRSLARSNAPDALKTFKWEFGIVLESVDPHTFIMCSGLLADQLYGAARLTILSKSAAFRGPFEELIMPDE
jgi:hypothetical protein